METHQFSGKPNNLRLPSEINYFYRKKKIFRQKILNRSTEFFKFIAKIQIKFITSPLSPPTTERNQTRWELLFLQFERNFDKDIPIESTYSICKKNIMKMVSPYYQETH